MSRRRFHNNDSKRYFDWIEASYTDLLCAKALRDDDDLYEPCAFHCQQCIEKVLKAYVLCKKHALLDGHNLTWLCKQAVKIDSAFKEWLDECGALNRYYIETRYPTDIKEYISKKMIDQAYKMSNKMFHFIIKELGIQFVPESFIT